MELHGNFDYDRELDSGIRVSVDYNSFEPESDWPTASVIADKPIRPYLEEILTGEQLRATEQELYGDSEVSLHGMSDAYHIAYKFPEPDRDAAEAFVETFLDLLDDASA